MKREKNCDWCGEPLGYEDLHRELDSCGKPECDRQVRAMEREEHDNARFAAEQDDYERYR